MKRQHVETAPGRLCSAVRSLLTKAGQKGARTKEEREEAVALQLGWAVSSVQTWGGFKVKAKKEQLPRLDILLRFFAATDYSADYIFFGTGPEKRMSKEAGGKLSRDALAKELATHLLPIIREGQTMTLHAIDGREALRAVEEAAVADRDFVQLGDGEWIDSEAAALLGAVMPRLKPGERADYVSLAEYLKRRASAIRRKRLQRVRTRDVRIVVDGDTLTDSERPVYRAADRAENSLPPWLVKVKRQAHL